MPRHLMVRRENNSPAESPVKNPASFESPGVSKEPSRLSLHQPKPSSVNSSDFPHTDASIKRQSLTSNMNLKRPSSLLSHDAKYMKMVNSENMTRSEQQRNLFPVTSHSDRRSEVRHRDGPYSENSVDDGHNDNRFRRNFDDVQPNAPAVGNDRPSHDDDVSSSVASTVETINLWPMQSETVQESQSTDANCYRFLGVKKNFLHRSGGFVHRKSAFKKYPSSPSKRSETITSFTRTSDEKSRIPFSQEDEILCHRPYFQKRSKDLTSSSNLDCPVSAQELSMTVTTSLHPSENSFPSTKMSSLNTNVSCTQTLTHSPKLGTLSNSDLSCHVNSSSMPSMFSSATREIAKDTLPWTISQFANVKSSNTSRSLSVQSPSKRNILIQSPSKSNVSSIQSPRKRIVSSIQSPSKRHLSSQSPSKHSKRDSQKSPRRLDTLEKLANFFEGTTTSMQSPTKRHRPSVPQSSPSRRNIFETSTIFNEHSQRFLHDNKENFPPEDESTSSCILPPPEELKNLEIICNDILDLENLDNFLQTESLHSGSSASHGVTEHGLSVHKIQDRDEDCSGHTENYVHGHDEKDDGDDEEEIVRIQSNKIAQDTMAQHDDQPSSTSSPQSSPHHEASSPTNTSAPTAPPAPMVSTEAQTVAAPTHPISSPEHKVPSPVEQDPSASPRGSISSGGYHSDPENDLYSAPPPTVQVDVVGDRSPEISAPQQHREQSSGVTTGTVNGSAQDSGVVPDYSANSSGSFKMPTPKRSASRRPRPSSRGPVYSTPERQSHGYMPDPLGASTPLLNLWRPWSQQLQEAQQYIQQMQSANMMLQQQLASQAAAAAPLHIPTSNPAQLFFPYQQAVLQSQQPHLPNVELLYGRNTSPTFVPLTQGVSAFSRLPSPAATRMPNMHPSTDTPLDLSSTSGILPAGYFSPHLVMSPAYRLGFVNGQAPSTFQAQDIIQQDALRTPVRSTASKKRLARPSRSSSQESSCSDVDQESAPVVPTKPLPDRSQPIEGVILGIPPRNSLPASDFVKAKRRLKGSSTSKGPNNEDREGKQSKRRDKPPSYGGKELSVLSVVFYECPEREQFCQNNKYKPPKVPDSEAEQEELRQSLLRLFTNSNMPKVPSALEYNVHALCYYPDMQHIFNLDAEGVDINTLTFGAYGQAFSNVKLQTMGEAKFNSILDKMSYVGEDGLLHCLVHRDIDDGALCDHVATELGKMRRHSKNHYPDKKWVCCFCRVQMSDMTDMERHTSIHTKLQPFRCVECGKDFAQKVTLETHMKNRHEKSLEKQDPKKSFTCRQDGCLFQEHQREACIEHLKKHHKQDDYPKRKRRGQWPFDAPSTSSKSS